MQNNNFMSEKKTAASPYFQNHSFATLKNNTGGGGASLR
jgi:hypothetical protein